MKIILIRYGELTLKGKNRKEFERILFNNIQKQLKGLEIFKFRKDRSRIYLEITGDENLIEITKRLKIIPGMHSFSVANQCENDLEAIKREALSAFDVSNPNFKIVTKRIYKDYPMLSNDVSRAVGGHVLFNNDGLPGLKVNIHNPNQLISIEIHSDCAYVFSQFQLGMGGLPIGTAGKGVVLLSGGIDSPIAAIMAMKRGVKITCIHFSSPPYTNQQSLDKVKSLIEILHHFDKDIKLYNINFSDLQLGIHQNCIDKYEITILRRMMIKKAAELANRIKTNVLITGESLGQVASQTMNGMYVSNSATDKLILRPLITMDKSEIIDFAKKYKTYEISTLPYEDCCVVFLPKNPSTNPKLEDVEKEEEKLDANLLNDCKYEVYKYDNLFESQLEDLL